MHHLVKNKINLASMYSNIWSFKEEPRDIWEIISSRCPSMTKPKIADYAKSLRQFFNSFLSKAKKSLCCKIHKLEFLIISLAFNASNNKPACVSRKVVFKL